MEIARLERLKTDLGVMMALSEKTGNDIRACLSVLHCLKSQGGKKITLAQVNSTSLGQKDSQKGLFTVWQEIFQIQRHTMYVYTVIIEISLNLYEIKWQYCTCIFFQTNVLLLCKNADIHKCKKLEVVLNEACMNF